MDYKIMLKSFEGPLDLLLHLISKSKIDIYNIPIHTITQQYMEYMYNMDKLHLEIASDFIVMASTLLQIKSKMLLPKENIIFDEDEFETDPRDKLIMQILEYKKFKKVAIKLKKLKDEKQKTYSRPKSDLSVYENETIDFSYFHIELLVKSLNNILIKNKKLEDMHIPRTLKKEEYRISDCMTLVLKKLEKSNRINFNDLWDKNTTNNEIITYFLSLLELVKIGKILVKQNETFSDLIIKKTFTGEMKYEYEKKQGNN